MRATIERWMISSLVAFAVVTAPMTPLNAARLAHAEENEVGPQVDPQRWATPSVVAAPRILLTTAETLALTTPRVSFPFRETTREIRLSSQATTAIIIGAVVVGVLLLVGLVVIAKPGKKP